MDNTNGDTSKQNASTSNASSGGNQEHARNAAKEVSRLQKYGCRTEWWQTRHNNRRQRLQVNQPRRSWFCRKHNSQRTASLGALSASCFSARSSTNVRSVGHRIDIVISFELDLEDNREGVRTERKRLLRLMFACATLDRKTCGVT